MHRLRFSASALLCGGALVMSSMAASSTPAMAATDHPVAQPDTTSTTSDTTATPTGSLDDAAAEHQAGLADDLIAKAEKLVKESERKYATAQRTAAKLRHRADRARGKADQARRDLGNMARAAYAGGDSEVLGLATLIDSPSPADTMRRAAVAQLVAEHQDAQWDQAEVLVGRVDELREQADAMVKQAREQLTAAQRLLKSVKGQRGVLAELGKGSSGGNGSAELARRCLSVDVLVPICAKPRWSEAHLTFDTVVIGRTVNLLWPQVKEVGGWRPSDPYPDHPSGRAADIMMPSGGRSAASVKLGNQIATYFQKHAAEYGIYYMIWRQRMWRASDPVGHWSGMSNRGDWTANHMDHVHITVTNGTSGTAWEALVLQARQQQAELG